MFPFVAITVIDERWDAFVVVGTDEVSQQGEIVCGWVILLQYDQVAFCEGVREYCVQLWVTEVSFLAASWLLYFLKGRFHQFACYWVYDFFYYNSLPINNKIRPQMSQKKSQHILAIQQILADFDIESQVRRITLQTMDAYMLGNKQAFTYIKQWQSKFIEFEARLVRAQTYYRNIQLNVNSKIQVTNSLNQRLEKFADQFWANVKESAESVEQMRKNYMNLVKETGTQAASSRNLDKEIKQTNKKIERLQDRLSQETTKLTEQVLHTEQSITLKNNERRSEAQSILLKLSTAKSQLESKAQLMQQLSKDLNLYKNQKVSIDSKITSLHEQLAQKVYISDFNKIRVYIDNSTHVNAKRIQEVYEEITSKIEQEVDVRKREILEGIKERQKINFELDKQIKETNVVLEQKFIKLSHQIQQLQAKTLKKDTQLQTKISQNKQRIQKTQTSIQHSTNKFQSIDFDLSDKQNRILEVQSNILSINLVLKNMEIENSKRNEELSRLKVNVDANDKSDIGEQVARIAEKIMEYGDGIRKLEERLGVMQGQSDGLGVEIRRDMGKLEKQSKEKISELEKAQANVYQTFVSKLDIRCNSIQQQIKTNQESMSQLLQKTIKQKIESIKDKFSFLENLNKQMQIFKKTFQEQLDMNDQLNKQVKQKMDRMFGMFTKLKSDAFMKIETLGQDIAKNVAKAKENGRVIGELCGVLSQYNEIITALLAVEMLREYGDDREPQQEYKIASLIEGWVLEVAKDKAKYRGEPSSKRALIQLVLQQHVKNGDKIKGGLIENGKQVFNRMAVGSEEYQQARRRSISRNKKQRQSELPKVFR